MIVLIEHDRILARTYQRALTPHAVIVARSAQAAVSAMDSEVPDLVILELQLGRHNGIELLYELRSYPDWQMVPVVIHTLVAPGTIELSGDVLKGLGVVSFL